MNKSSNKIVVFLLTCSLLLNPNTKLIACSCDIMPFDRAVENADEIFLGHITKAERYNNGVNEIDPTNDVFIIDEINWDWKFYFKVQKKWKGNSNEELVIYHHGTSCDLFFDIYKRDQLVYATYMTEEKMPFGVIFRDSNKKLSTWLCSRSVERLYNATDNWFQEDIDKLDELFPNAIELKNSYTWSWKYFSIALLSLFIVLFFKQRISLSTK